MMSVLSSVGTSKDYTDVSDYESLETPFDYEMIINRPKLCELVIRGAELGLINKFRRTILRNVETLAIDEVIIEINSSVIPEESIAHRLGLLPIKADSGLCGPHTENESCDKCSIPFVLEAVGDLTYKKKITSDDITFKGGCHVTGISPFVLQYLHPGEKICLKGFVEKGRGSKHSKWCPVSAISFAEIEPRVFRFRFENSGQLSNEEILQTGLYALIQEG